MFNKAKKEYEKQRKTTYNKEYQKRNLSTNCHER